MSKPLTKSLHTVTATVNVARLILASDPRIGQRTLASKALETLGYDIDAFPSDDPTVAKIMHGCGKLIRDANQHYSDAQYWNNAGRGAYGAA